MPRLLRKVPLQYAGKEKVKETDGWMRTSPDIWAIRHTSRLGCGHGEGLGNRPKWPVDQN